VHSSSIKVREAAGLVDYTGATDASSLRDEILKQRRYSLFAEGHRWVDMRRFNRLDQIQVDNADEMCGLIFLFLQASRSNILFFIDKRKRGSRPFRLSTY